MPSKKPLKVALRGLKHFLIQATTTLTKRIRHRTSARLLWLGWIDFAQSWLVRTAPEQA